MADCTLPGNYHVGSPQLPSTLVTMEKIRYATPKVEVRSLEDWVASINFSVQFPEPVKGFLPGSFVVQCVSSQKQLRLVVEHPFCPVFHANYWPPNFQTSNWFPQFDLHRTYIHRYVQYLPMR